MKHINESIIGRKGTYSSSKLWLIYPVSDDYRTALEVLPDDCRIHFDSTSLFCVNLPQLKEFFDSLSGDNMLTHRGSVLFEIDSHYLKNFKDVKDWIIRLSSTEEFHSLYSAKELNEIIAANIPKYIKNL